MTNMVLITGGADYIGSHAILALRDANFDVAVLDDLSSGRRSAVPSDVRFYLGDVADPFMLDQIAREIRPIAILHFAGSTLTPDSFINPLKYYRNNTAVTHSLVESAVRNGIRHLVFSSTAAVYGAHEAVPVNEAEACQPISPYGKSKLMAEWMLADVALLQRFNYAALRLFNVAGADPLARTGQTTNNATHMIKVALEAAVGKRRCVTVHGDDYNTRDGTCIRDYVHVSDIGSACLAALRKILANPERSLILNCGSGKGTSVLEVLDAVDRVSGVTLNRKLGQRRPGDMPVLVAATAHIYNTLGWIPRYSSLDTIIEHALAWERANEQRAPPGTINN